MSERDLPARLSELPVDYATTLASLSAAVRSANIRAVRQVNAELVTLYWNIGRIIRERQTVEGWGTKVVDRLAADLRREFPRMTGFSPRNLNYMLQLATAFTEPILPQAVAKLPWGHIRELLPLSDTPEVQIFYIERCAQEGWSRSVLLNQIKSQLHLRVGVAPSNFTAVESPESSELVSQLIKDPYNFEFLTLASDAAEREVEHGLVANLAKTLQELGVGFYYVGRQHRLTLTDADGQVDEFFLDLLFYHHLLRRFVVFELKIDKFRPEFAGKLNFYCNVVDDQLRHYDGLDGPTIGILLCASKSNVVVDYALRNIGSPMAVSEYTYNQLPPELQDALPSPADLQPIVDEAVGDAAPNESIMVESTSTSEE